jgi:hypothetical protein
MLDPQGHPVDEDCDEPDDLFDFSDDECDLIEDLDDFDDFLQSQSPIATLDDDFPIDELLDL